MTDSNLGKPKRKESKKSSGICCSVVMPLLIGLTAVFIYPLMRHSSILGANSEFTDCTVRKIDQDTGRIFLTNETIEIIPVDYGLKMVEAETLDGAMFGMGFAMASDRLWQLNFYRLLSQGRLSEILGAKGLEVDMIIRTIGIPRTGRAVVESLNDEELLALENFAAGINKVAQNIKVYPVEFYLFWTDFEPWTPIDSVTFSQFLKFSLCQDAFNEMMRERLLEVYDMSLVEKLMPFRPEHYFQHDNMFTIQDEELDKIGFLLTPEEAEKELFTMSDDLIYTRDKQKTIRSKTESLPKR